MLVTAAIFGLVYLTESRQWVPVFYYKKEIILFIAFITTVIYGYARRFIGTPYFVHMFLLSLVVKLLASVIFLLFVVLPDTAHANASIILFMPVYMVFTALEIGFLYPGIAKINHP